MRVPCSCNSSRVPTLLKRTRSDRRRRTKINLARIDLEDKRAASFTAAEQQIGDGSGSRCDHHDYPMQRFKKKPKQSAARDDVWGLSWRRGSPPVTPSPLRGETRAGKFRFGNLNVCGRRQRGDVIVINEVLKPTHSKDVLAADRLAEWLLSPWTDQKLSI
ncbi:hypothetical protein EVAR_51860_1 [Eumeta japonica]|uniref:Uncharacterized protein n=1 Tax=Eumeta variegata TaxID=151549 RepID=A0A4C1YU39_EUMVA|nr:hypothetical protein EVAR_51860_1 [Eumeta japonica]